MTLACAPHVRELCRDGLGRPGMLFVTVCVRGETAPSQKPAVPTASLQALLRWPHKQRGKRFHPEQLASLCLPLACGSGNLNNFLVINLIRGS